MSDEIKIENADYAATFVINNGKDVDICQLFEKDKQYERVVLLNDWVRRDFFDAKIKEKDEEINSLKQSRTTLLKTVINITEDVLDKALKNSSLNSAYYDKLLDCLDRLLDYSEGDKTK